MTIAREIKAKGGRGEYRLATLSVAQRGIGVARSLREKWSPQQISERLIEDHPTDLEMRASHETIYECLYRQARGALRAELKLACPTSRGTASPGTRGKKMTRRADFTIRTGMPIYFCDSCSA
ncbi:hypothetical protein [Actinoalloteichus caeruleus]|uniref:hypothetical protein n=1 Tax=Actinoalloteichus cyanogriseus TaxID=2893586 RepID=UPI0012DBFF15